MLCNVCLKNEVSPNSEIDFCLACHFSGRVFESFLLSEERKNILGRVRELAHVTEAGVWHMGDGRFNLMIMLEDGRCIAPGAAMEDGEKVIVQPLVPPMGVAWGIAIATPVLADGQPMQEMAFMQAAFDDDGLVEMIEKIANGEVNPEPEEIENLDERIEQIISDALDATWVTGVGQLIAHVHSPDKCEGQGCVVHHPSDHALVDMKTIMIPREIQVTPPRTMRICEHDVQHPDPDDVAYYDSLGIDIRAHECDGCCDQRAV